MSASYNKDGTPRESQAAHFSGATGAQVKMPSGLTSDEQYFKDIAKSLKELPKGKVRDTDPKLLDFNKGGKRRKTRRNKRKSRRRKSKRRISRKR